MKQGDIVWIQYERGVYLGEVDGKHLVGYEEDDAYIEKSVKYIPLPEDNWEPPALLQDGRYYYKYTGKKTAWLRDAGLRFYYEYASTSTFKQSNHFDRAELDKMEPVPDGHFLDSEELDTQLYEFHKQKKPILDEIERLKEKLREIEKEKKLVQDRCFHEWELIEETEGERGFLGTTVHTRHACKICDYEKSGSHTRLS